MKTSHQISSALALTGLVWLSYHAGTTVGGSEAPAPVVIELSKAAKGKAPAESAYVSKAQAAHKKYSSPANRNLTPEPKGQLREPCPDDPVRNSITMRELRTGYTEVKDRAAQTEPPARASVAPSFHRKGAITRSRISKRVIRQSPCGRR